MKYHKIIKLSVICICVLTWIISSCQSNPDRKVGVILGEEETRIFELATNYFRPLTLPDSLYHTVEDSLKISLGQKLFYDKNLSSDGKMSCNTCHPIEDFGMDRRSTAMGHNKRIGKRNTPTVFNAFLQYAQFWDARVSTVEEQLIVPLLDPSEMAMKDTVVLLKYVNEAYKEIISEAYHKLNVGLSELKHSIGSFERTLITPSRFDDYLSGKKDALSVDEKQGLSYFMQEGCTSCHSGVLLGGNMAQKFALFGYYWDFTGSDTYDDGIYAVTKNASDKFMFKVSGLRNITNTAPYFHDGSVDELYAAIDIMAKAELGKTLEPEIIKKIELFLGSLTGELHNYRAPED